MEPFACGSFPARNPEDTEVIENQTETFSWKYEAFNDRLTLTGDSLVLSDFAESALTPWYPYIDKIQFPAK